MDQIDGIAQNVRRTSGKFIQTLPFRARIYERIKTINCRVSFIYPQLLLSAGNRKDKNSSAHSPRHTSTTSSSSSHAKHAKPPPEPFVYIKAATNGGCAMTTPHEGQTMLIGTSGGRTAHVSAVPRSNKLKVSGGTQTCTADLQMKVPPPNTQHRSFSLTGPSAAQLSQSIRERFANGSHSLPKPGVDMNVFQQRYVPANWFEGIFFLLMRCFR